jgi:hypothetical protein
MIQLETIAGERPVRDGRKERCLSTLAQRLDLWEAHTVGKITHGRISIQAEVKKRARQTGGSGAGATGQNF